MVSKSRSQTVIQAVRKLLLGCRDVLRARAGQAGGDIAFGPESDVSSGKDFRTIRASNSSTICWSEHETEIRRGRQGDV